MHSDKFNQVCCILYALTRRAFFQPKNHGIGYMPVIGFALLASLLCAAAIQATTIDEKLEVAVAPIQLTIPIIQGTGTVSSVQGEIVETTGVVVGDFQASNQLGGFFLQDLSGDGILATSDGIFVVSSEITYDVEVGDKVTVTAIVGSFNDNTRLESVSNIAFDPCTMNQSCTAVTPTIISLPESVNGELERYEGMLVQIDQTMTITQNFFLSRHGQLSLSSPNENFQPGRLFVPTNQFTPNSVAATNLAAENARRLIFLDDGMEINTNGDNPDPVPYLGGPPASPLRSGDTTEQIIGVLEQGLVGSGSPDYRIHPTMPPVFVATNSRKSQPSKAGSGLRIASFNVLNYFNTIDTSTNENPALDCGPPGAAQRCRGADSAAEFTRQRDKIFTGLAAIDADIVGLMEIENNGFDADSAIQDLVTGLNAKIGSDDYTFLDVTKEPNPGIGNSVITVGIIYKPSSVTPIGTPAVLETGEFFGGSSSALNRPPIAASFLDKLSGEKLTVAVNHFKSKSPPNSPLDNENDDQLDGQGAWNSTRTLAAEELANWLATTNLSPTGVVDSDILVLGDLNSYAKEDPLVALESAGYTNLVKQFEGDDSYSFTFNSQAGSLDHMLATASLTAKVASVETWHSNTDEPTILDYNTEFKTNIAPAPAGYYVNDPFRASDHDPVVITLRSKELCRSIKASNGEAMTLCL
jgi:predicted extracellular nuclease